jgi:hypothetical protein
MAGLAGLAAAAALLAAQTAHAADDMPLLPAPVGPSETVWTCWLGLSHESLACLLTEAAEPNAQVKARLEARLDPRLPQQVRSMRLTPQAWRARTVFIPLHGTAFADSSLGLLAQSVMCGTAPACRAVMHTDPLTAEPRFVTLLADANDPLLAE